VEGVSRGAGDTSAASAQVLAAAGELSLRAEEIRDEVGSYIGAMKAA
jgi:hypothetical protein